MLKTILPSLPRTVIKHSGLVKRFLHAVGSDRIAAQVWRVYGAGNTGKCDDDHVTQHDAVQLTTSS